MVALTWVATASPAAAQRPAPNAPAALDQALAYPTADLIRAHLAFLADDVLEGRAPGTRGGHLAARYIAAQFAAAGLEPGAPNASYFQPVPLIGVTPTPSAVVGIGRQTVALEHGREFVAWPIAGDSAVAVDAELVFVGYGIQATEWDWDDFKGQSVTGRILVMLVNDPGLTDASRFEGRKLTYYGHWTYKLEQAARLGAVGAILIHSDEGATYRWNAVRSSWTGEQLIPADGAPPTLRFGAWITEDAAARLTDATGRDFSALRRRAQQPSFRPVSLGAHAVVHIRSTVRRFEGQNVIARLPGADTVGRNDAVIFTAHYDHLGIGRPVDGDSIYNGAEDNASGVATMLAAAAGFGRATTRPRRTLLFLATTAKESGLLGAESYASGPVMPLERTVAVVNLDRANLRGMALDAVALGSDRSDLGASFAQAARDEGLTTAPDPNPRAGSFFRSDHFPFARSGVPVLSLRVPSRFANRPVGWADEQEAQFLASRYHQPSDEYRSAFDFTGAVQQARLLIRLGWLLGDSDQFPAWNPDAEFRVAGERLRRLRRR